MLIDPAFKPNDFTQEVNYLSLGAVTLIRSVLSNLPVYHVPIFKCPILVVKKVEKLQRDFLWCGRNLEKKFHLLDCGTGGTAELCDSALCFSPSLSCN